MENNITALDAVRAFYIAEKLLRNIILSAKKDEKKLKRELEKAVKKVSKMPLEKLVVPGVMWGPRFDNYFNSEWRLELIPLAECGVWPRMGGLPDAATTGTVVDTAEYIRPYLSGKKRMNPKMKRALYIEKLGNVAEIITEHVPIVVLEDSVIRHTKLRPEKERKAYQQCAYDIDDGNHRAVSLALAGKTHVIALVGKRLYKSGLLF